MIGLSLTPMNRALRFTLPGLVLVVVVVLVAAVTATLITDDNGKALPKPTAANGLIAYSYAGDIYVGDPVTGETSRITTNPRYEVNPVFSPNGKRIAFIRGNPQTKDSTIVVVRADGSDERVLLPQGRKHRGFVVLAWTPDGSSLVAQLDRTPFILASSSDGELSLFDSFGTGDERRLAPPLPTTIGGHYFSTDAEVVPMFRPPKGDRILSGGPNKLDVLDADFATVAHLAKVADLETVALTAATRAGFRESYESYGAWWPTWSPDGARILFWLIVDGSGNGVDVGGTFVMNAEGDDLRPLGPTHSPLWSPDGSRIAFGRVRAETDRAVIVVVDPDTGEERRLASTSAAGKEAGARFPTLTYNNVVHHWHYEGWKWAPDGRSLLVFENHRTRPWVVDIETDTVTKLPWLADSMPSWQRVAID
jgi:dipeptidyl aminopeptidase/acylaminoacyl peptidase